MHEDADRQREFHDEMFMSDPDIDQRNLQILMDLQHKNNEVPSSQAEIDLHINPEDDIDNDQCSY